MLSSDYSSAIVNLYACTLAAKSLIKSVSEGLSISFFQSTPYSGCSFIYIFPCLEGNQSKVRHHILERS